MPPKREMSHSEYADQQFYYKHDLKDPIDLQNLFDETIEYNLETNEEIKEKRSILIEKLIELVKFKITNSLTKRQREAISLFLLSKKQEYAAEILGVSQPAFFSRLKISFKRLKRVCEKDKEIKKILLELKNLPTQ